jgi:uridine phosphorylase
MEQENRLPTLRARPSQIAPLVLVVGDPNRAEEASHLLEGAEEVGNFREYRTFTGQYQGQRVTIASHGVGAGGANMCFHELFQCGLQAVIRAGTCGAMQPEMNDGDLVVGTGAIREDGVTAHMMPLSFPALADRHVQGALIAACRDEGIANPHEGIILSQSYFYPGVLPNECDFWLKTGLAAAVEMEFSLLLVMAATVRVRAGGIFVTDGNLTRTPDPNDYNPHRAVVQEGKARMLRVALNALVRLGQA